MTATSNSGADPRRSTGPAAASDEQPIVGEGARTASPLIIVGVFAVAAIALFLVLNGRRSEQTASLITPASGETALAAPPQPLDIAPTPATPPPVQPATPLQPVAAAPASPPPPDDTVQRLHAPPVVVDLQSGHATGVPISMAGTTPARSAIGSPASTLATGETSSPLSAAASGVLPGSSGTPLMSGAAGAGTLNPNEQFAASASEAAPEPAVATQMINLGFIVTQGTTIPAVLETAINSDLPGFTRAIVSRDVLAFDGKAVLIPRGSRVIGQYRNALSLGQSRVFIIWTRLIRPDGVTVQIGSPGDDALGRGGLTGSVETHFFARFGGAILLSVLNAGTAAIAGTPSTQISIGSPAAAAGAAATATIPTGTDILPTIKVNQGAAINIFVARDLDFSAVKPVN